jgi:hypothetical protein
MLKNRGGKIKSVNFISQNAFVTKFMRLRESRGALGGGFRVCLARFQVNPAL